MSRLIGIRHRVKRTALGEARPTMVAIHDGEAMRTLELPDDGAEKDFLLGIFPTKWRKAEPGEKAGQIPERHCKYRKDPMDEENQILDKVPAEYEGFQPGDIVLMILGGSGDRFAAALMRRGEALTPNATVLRIPPFQMKEARGAAGKDMDHEALIQIYLRDPSLFREMARRDWDLVCLREAFFARGEAMRARIGCEQRLRQQVIGRIFLNREGQFEEGSIEAEYDKEKASDAILQGFLEEEARRDRDLKATMRALPVWKLFEPIEGCGETIAAGLVSAIGDIRLFESKAKLKAFCGVHVLPDGTFARRKAGVVANWSPCARQALYLLADQMNRRPKSTWGKRLREIKARFREVHPQPVEIERGGKTIRRYTDGHIHKMALWRAVTKFTEWLFREWKNLEEPKPEPAPVSTP